uniref:Uncharacterized protein n=1 Tax=Paramormyrops kingsleyae TaxID=1676925 RepID=A0A3B3RNI3_9TELE
MEEAVTSYMSRFITSKTDRLPIRSVSRMTSPCPVFTVDSSAEGVLDVIDYYDREGAASAKGTYTKAMTYEIPGFIDKPGKRLPKVGAYAAAGVGLAKAEYSVFEAEAKGPNASAGASVSLAGVSAMASAEIASASASAGPIKAKIGLGVDTGVKVGLGGVEVRVLGTGISIGQNPAVAVLGNEVECSVM